MEPSLPGVSESFLPLLAATALFVASHFILSAVPVRGPLVARLGERPFLGAYSAVALVAFAWMVFAYVHAPFEDLWGDPPWARWLALAAMPLAAVLLVAGVTTANPGAVGQERLLSAGREPAGIQKVTRHPVMSAIALWAALHLLANGDLASAILFGGLLVLAAGGIAHIEARKGRTAGEAWARFAGATSIVPFAALASGRARVTLAEIGWIRIAGGLALYAVLLLGHGLVSGAALVPGLAAR